MTVDALAKRVGVYAAAIIAVLTLSAATVRWVTRDVQAAIEETRIEVRQARTEFRGRAAADSTRFERVMEVVELAVVALVETPGSEEQRSAVVELRKRRHVTPRQ